MGRRAKIGLALGGGGVRGLAHLGVLSALEEAHVPVDLIAGTSMGGIVAGLYGAGVPLKRAIDTSCDLGLMDLACLDRSRWGLFGPAKLRGLLADVLGDAKIRFEDLRIPIALVAADLERGELVLLREGPLIPALLATCAFPLVFPPVRHGDRWLVDGGVLNNYPVDVVRRMGADRVLGVLTPSRFVLPAEKGQAPGRSSNRRGFPLRRRSRDWRLPFRIAGASAALTTAIVNETRLRRCPPDVHLVVSFPNVGVFATAHTAECVDAGYHAAMRHLPEILALRDIPLASASGRALAHLRLRLRRAWAALREPIYPLHPE